MKLHQEGNNNISINEGSREATTKLTRGGDLKDLGGDATKGKNQAYIT